MPLLQVNVLPGYSDEIKQRLCAELTWTISGVTGAQPAGINVWVHEVPSHSYSRGGEPRTPAPAPELAATEVVRQFLAAMEARDLDSARRFLADGFQMRFPGGAEFSELEDLVAWSKTRYRFVTKTLHSLQSAYEAERVVVFCHGELAGEWPDGSAFSGVRFIDRFELKAGQLWRQDVWNDLALFQPAPATDNEK